MDYSTYDITAVAYGKRAFHQLKANTAQSLFYAAWELRCGVEARQAEYMEARHDIAKHKRKGWRIAAAGKELERAFRAPEPACEITLQFSDGEEIGLLYTPVTRELRKIAEKIVSLLHAQSVDHSDEEKWSLEHRGIVSRGVSLLMLSVAGTLLAPPIWNPENGNSRICARIDQGTSDQIMPRLKSGATLSWA